VSAPSCLRKWLHPRKYPVGCHRTRRTRGQSKVRLIRFRRAPSLWASCSRSGLRASLV
jgi:hypothetical protein